MEREPKNLVCKPKFRGPRCKNCTVLPKNTIEAKKKSQLTKEMSNKKEKIPALRFPEFQNSGEWEDIKLGDCLSYLQPTPYLVESTNYSEDKGVPVLTAGKSFVLGYTDEEKGIFRDKLPVIIFDDFTTASQFVNFPFKVKSSAIKILLAQKKYDIKFVFESMQILRYEVGVHKRHWISVYSKKQITIPSLPEQQKIADCLSSLDDLIDNHSEKLALLEKHKKGLMQKLFPREGQKVPELRFPEFQNDGEWEFINGNKLFKTISNKNHNSDLPILAITQYKGAIPREEIDYHVSVSKNSIKNYKVVEPGNFIISLRSFQGGIEYSEYLGLCSPAYIILRKKKDLDNNFYKHYFKSFPLIQELNKNLEGIRDGKMVSFKQFSEILMPFPSHKEQQKIADCLSSLDNLITAERENIEQLKQHKKGLMQGLFVN